MQVLLISIIMHWAQLVETKLFKLREIADNLKKIYENTVIGFAFA